MKKLFFLSFKSIQNRKVTFLLSVLSITISVILLLGVDKIIKSSKIHFINTINSTDLIVSSSNGSLDIMLNLIFHISDPLKEISYKSFEDIKNFKEVAWNVPISLGDSFKNFDVVSTNNDYFEYYKYASSKKLDFAKGNGLVGFYDVVLGSEVAKKLNLKINDTIYISHGSKHQQHIHKNRPFKIAGILKKTMTPNDESIFMQLKADEAIHIEWQSGHFVNMHISSEKLSHMNIKPKHISGMILGLKNRSDILNIQNKINHYKEENLKAVIPARALAKLYTLIKNIQDLLTIISIAVFIAAIFTMLSTMYSTLNERKREIAILRSLGASVKIIFLLFAVESFLIVFSGFIIAIVILIILSFFSPIEIALSLDLYEFTMLLSMLIIALFSSLLPAYRSYENSLSDGLTVRL